MAQAASSYTLFESGQVRPLALSPDGKQLFAVNTPDNRLEVFRVRKSGVTHINSIPVGLEPVAVAARSNTEIWVVNHLSDSISIVDLRPGHFPRVVRTLLVGDEPRDIVFAGLGNRRAFITAAHRGQNLKTDPHLTTPGTGRADVWVFDADHLGDSLTGDPLTVITLFTDMPRALAATPDGQRVYAAGFQTGNRTTTINEFLVRQATRPFEPNAHRVYPGPQPNRPDGGPWINYAGIEQPTVGLIVKFELRSDVDPVQFHWYDELGQIWDDMVAFDLPDKDVFTLDAIANPPVSISNGEYHSVGTVLFNMIVNPSNGLVYVTNTEARNQHRFEGIGTFSGGQTLRGHFSENRITVLGREGRVEPRHLNKHVDYSRCCDVIPNEENAKSVALPLDMAITHDGSTLYAAMFGSGEVAVYNTLELENDTWMPDTANQITVSGGGPSGLALDEKHSRLYVLTRFDNAISIIDTKRRAEIAHVGLYNPEPAHIVAGRRFLYDASWTSSHGDSACASCHTFGDFDSLAWDLGDPDGDQMESTGPFMIESNSQRFQPPMKGPMTTQSLRGLDNHGAMHWRGDRTGDNTAILGDYSGPNVQPNGGAFNEDLAFRKFNTAFVGLNGRHEMLSAADMQAFADFILEISYPPNPIRNLDNSLTAQQQAGRDFFCGPSGALVCNGGQISNGIFSCNGCHRLDHSGNAEFFDVRKPGFFGTDGRFSSSGSSQFFKVPHLRNLYQRVGMFGMPPNPPYPSVIAPLGSAVFFPLANTPLPNNRKEEIRGFGFIHDGSVDTLFRFLSLFGFFKGTGNPGGLPDPTLPDQDPISPRRDIEAFLLAFDSNLAPIVGQQITLNRRNGTVVGPRIDLLMARADVGECDLVAKNRLGGFLYIGDRQFRISQRATRTFSDAWLRAKARRPDGETTYTCMPPGSGLRIGLDRDEDGLLDGNDPHLNRPAPGNRGMQHSAQ